MSDPNKETAMMGFLISVIGVIAVVIALCIGEIYGLFDQ
jgi:hypothetical protein